MPLVRPQRCPHCAGTGTVSLAESSGPCLDCNSTGAVCNLCGHPEKLNAWDNQCVCGGKTETCDRCSKPLAACRCLHSA